MNPRAILLLVACVLLPASPAAADRRLSDLLLQIQRLQQQVQQLQGRFELQQYELSLLERRQQEQYLDLDARLRGLGMNATPGRGAGNTGGTGALSAPTGAIASSAAEEKELYRVAFDLLRQRRYKDAIRGFEDLLARYPNEEFADNARYWLGEANYVERNYEAALTQFQHVAADYPQSPKVPGALLKIGYIHHEKGDRQRARRTLREILDRFPDTTEAHQAESRLERMTREGR
ncbi:MAG: tol-pal system protein YbgF [Candidatus Thiosymbion ectosymbiont of Robbea hypermnestra]|nr:tol-pal system protein YbgF [Candidatus Thiosymbion ectosymbiont of Robbea hypermnestra]